MRATAIKPFFWSLTLLILPALAEPSSSLQSIDGNFSPGRGRTNTNASEEVFAAAGRNPNATSALEFNRTDFSTPGSWIWRINITDVPLPNDFNDLGRPSANASEDVRIINTQYQLLWPGATQNMSLQQYLQTNNLTVYVTSLAVSLSSSQTSKYNSMANGTCADILGDECTQSLMSATATMDQGFGTLGLQGCANSLDKSQGIGGIGFVISPNGTADIMPDNALYYHSSPAFTGNNQTFLNQAKRAVNILALDFRTGPRSQGSGSPDSPSVLCQVVDKTATVPSAASSFQVWSLGWSFTLLSTVFALSL